MKKKLSFVAIILASFLATSKAFSQTSWKGTVNTNWNNAGNWTSGIPNSGTDVVIGDGNFTGPNQPMVNAVASCNSITIGGAVASTLTLTKNLVVNGDFIISSNGTISHPRSTLSVKGDWVNDGTYTTSNSNSRVIFAGNSQLISGSVSTSFRDITINAAAKVTLGTNISATGSGSAVMIKGSLDPGQSPTYSLTSTVNFRIYNNGKINVNSATFAANYILSGTVTFSNGSSVEYSSTTVNQTISSAYSYSNLIISGTGAKSLSSNLPSLNSSTSKQGNIFVNSGTFDLASFTANRGTNSVGGSFNVTNGAYLKLGGASNFPTNYKTIVLTLGSTTEYNGINQTVSAQSYGNLIFSSKSGAAIKTLPNTDFTIEGNFSSLIGTGSSVSYTALSNISVNGNVSIGASTTFNAGNFSHSITGNWVNNGTFTGSSSTIIFDGPSSAISGSGNQNFNDISVLVSGITVLPGTFLNVSGNISTSGPGGFTQLSGGMITMTGSSKSISGAGIVFNDLTVSGTVTSTASFTINGNLSVPGSFSASAGTIILAGVSKTISGSGSKNFSALQVTGTITTAFNFSVSALLDVSGTMAASAGTATFTGSSILSGTANLFNVSINGTSLQLSAASVLGIANVLTITSGILDVTSSLPNTVNFNGTGSQNINSISYNNLLLSNGNTKTAAGNISVNGNITIASSTTFNGATYSHTVLRNWINNGTFTPSTSTIQFSGANNSTISGVTSFNTITINKSSATSTVSLLNSINSSIVNMISGKILTGTNKITITNTRNGSGIILGTITRTHPFSTGTSYAFEGPENTIKFSSAVGITSVTVSVILGNIGDFPDNASINREYDIAVTGTSYNAILRLHYDDAELNGNDETGMGLWNYSGSWTSAGKSANSSINNYVEQSGLTNISTRWTCSEIPGVARWNGSSSSDWNTASNWTNVSGTASTPPAATDIVQIGTASFTNQPTISNPVNIKAIIFGSAQAATLTLAAGGSLATTGNIGGNFSADVNHTINVGNQNLTVNGDLILSNGTSNRSINLNIGSGTLNVIGSLIQKGNSSVVFAGGGSINIGSDYVYSSGTFTPGTGSVAYNGSGEQDIALLPYNNLTVNNTIGNATVAPGSTLNISGNLSLLSGRLELDNSSMTIAGNVNLASGATLDCNSVIINAGGNWTNNGTYLHTTGTVNFVGTGTQNISAGNFNNLTINKLSGVANLQGNNTLAGDLLIQQGTLNISTYTLNRQSAGGSFSMSAGTTLQVGGSNNFPSLYSSNLLNQGSTVFYNGSVSQSISPVNYGNLTFSNGGSNPKTQTGPISVSGDLLISSGATFNASSYSTLLKGNWTNNGSFNASTGTVILNGASKTLTGNTTFNGVTINGSYTVVGSDMTYNGLLWVTSGASFISDGHATVSGDLTNNGTLIGYGTTTFSGTSLQTIRLVNALVSSSTGIVNFNGNVSPILNSNSSPQFATLNINNTAGLNPSVGGTVYIALNVNTGAKLSIDNATYNIYGSFTNAGTITSTGTINFIPVAPKTIALGSSGFSSDGTINFGGSGQITLTGKPDYLNTVIISNTNSAGVSPSSDWTIDSNFVVAENANFNAGSYTYNVGGDIISDGTLNGMTSTFITSNDDGNLSASAETYFNNLTNTGTLTPQTDYKVEGYFTNNGTYDGSIGTLIMSGGKNAGINGSAALPIAQLTIQKSDNAMVTQNTSITNLTFLNIVSGILFTSTKTITQDGSGGFLIVGDNATLKLGGNNSLPGFSGVGLDVNSFVDYAGVGTIQAIGNAASYGNLIISGTGNKNAFLPVVVSGNLSISSGVLNTSTFTVQHSIAGNFTMSGGTLLGTNSTYIMNGTNDQSLSLMSNLIKLTVNKPSGKVTLGSDITVNNILTFTSGNIKTGNFKVVIPSGGSVVGAGQSTGWLNGNLQKNVALGASISRTFEIGDSINYTPASLVFSNVTTAGDFIAKVTPADQPQAYYSAIDITKSVNRYWSLTNAGVGFSSADITFNWVATDLDAGANTANFKTGEFDGTNWISNAVASPLSTSIKTTGCTGFGDFEIGEALSQFKWTGNAMTSDWNTKENWLGGIPTTTMNTLIPSGISGGRVYPVISSFTAKVNDVAIENSAALVINGGTLQISGAISNSGTFDVTDGTLEMNGASAQTIEGSMFTDKTIKNLIVSNTSVAGLSVSATAGDTLKITGALTFGNSTANINTGDNITFVSNSLGTARLGILGTGNSISGKAIVERYINTGTGAGQHGKSWQFLSVPTNGQTIKESWMENGSIPNNYGTMISGPGGTGSGFDIYSVAPSMKYFDESTNNWKGVSNTSNLISNTGGYMVFIRGDRNVVNTAAPANATILRTKGTLFTGDQLPITVKSNKSQSVGNPYASPIDFSLITKDASIDNAFYVYDPYLYGSYGTGGFQTLSSINNWKPIPGGTSAYPTNVLSSIIQSGQAFFVHSSGAVDGSLTIKEDCKSTAARPGHSSRIAAKAMEGERQFLNASLVTSTGLMADGNLVAFDKTFRNTIDGNDIVKMTNSGENFGVKSSGKLLTIEAKSPLSVSDTIYYNISNLKKANYRLIFSPENMEPTGLQGFLIDKFLNTESPVSLSDSTFIDVAITSNPASAGADRFKIVFRQMGTLPVTITSIIATNKGENNLIQWTVENESDIQQYEVEKSTDGNQFTQMAIVNANNTKSGNYEAVDKNVNDGINYYRVKIISVDGKPTYTKIVKVANANSVGSISVFPNPITDGVIHLQLRNQPTGNYKIRLYNSAGQVLISKNIIHSEGNAKEDIRCDNLPKGIYQLIINMPSGRDEVVKIIK